jgi:acetyl esterase/lipase
MKLIGLSLLPFLLAGCTSSGATGAASLTQARQGFQTSLQPQQDTKEAAEVAPASVFSTVKYTAPGGQLAAYVSPNPGDGKKHPAIVWITGGDCNTIGDVWTPAPPDNDQTAAAFRKAGIVMMFPSLRGGNDNPGAKEGFLGEVDDVLAASKYLESQTYVDPKRIYLGGHSTGGTLALLTAECSDRFRAVFAFGPVEDISGYGADSGFLPFDIKNEQEVQLRSPGYWLDSVRSPTWVLEGSGGNIESLRALEQASSNVNLHFVEVKGANHFSALAPTNTLIAQKIVADTGETTDISLSTEDASQNFAR